MPRLHLDNSLPQSEGPSLRIYKLASAGEHAGGREPLFIVGGNINQ